MKHAVKHDLDMATAKRATVKAIESYKERFAEYNPSLSWVSDTKGNLSFAVKGMAVKGDVELVPGAIEFDIDVPFLLKPFKSTAIEVIDRQIQKWIAKAKAGEI